MALGAAGAIAVTLATAPSATAAPPPATVSQTFTYTGNGNVQSFSVPWGVTSVQVTTNGGAGASGGSYDGAVGASGAQVTGTLAVSAGTTLAVVVGQGGSTTAPGLNGAYTGGAGSTGNGEFGASDGGGGGAASTVSYGGTLDVVAGGGGGGGGFGAYPAVLPVTGGAGGTGGTPAGQNGSAGTSYYSSQVPSGAGGTSDYFTTYGQSATDSGTFGGPGAGGGGGGYDGNYGGGGGAGSNGAQGGGGGGAGGYSYAAAGLTSVSYASAGNAPASESAAAGNGTVTISYQQVTTTTTMYSETPNPSQAGQAVYFYVNVASTDGCGTVSLTVDGVALPATTGCENMGLQHNPGDPAHTYFALCYAGGNNFYQWSVGTHSVVASYTGDTTYAPSSVTVSQVVNPASTSTTISANTNGTYYGSPITFTATVANSDGGGTVGFTYSDYGTPGSISGCSAQPLTYVGGGNDQATCTTTTLPVGKSTVTATYSGDTNFATSSGSLTGQLVYAEQSYVSVGGSPNPSLVGQPVTITTTVTDTDGGGTVNLQTDFTVPNYCHNMPLIAQSNGSYTATCTATPPAGNREVQAYYSGDTNTESPGLQTYYQKVNPLPAVHSVLITQLRFDGPAGSADEFIELYNNSASAINLSGWALDYLDANGTLQAVQLPATSVPTHAHFLVAGPQYSLTTAPDLSAAGLDVPSTGGVQVVGPGNTLVDAVGMSTASPAFREGAGLPASASSAGQYAYVRNAANAGPVQSGNNAADFQLAGPVSAGGAQGIASPRDLASGVFALGVAPSTLLNPKLSAGVAPNRSVSGSMLTVRRTITNTSTSATVTSLVLRMTAISVQGGPPSSAHAWLVAQPAPATQTFTIDGSPVTVYGISPDAGTGWNTTYTVLLPGGKLGPGQSVSVAMQFQAVQSGAYSFTYQPEATIAP
ncbi:MAG: Ig-like domain repeat protein [Jatrophihabitantaceae bacterium]